jgi:hypothetical protein
MSNTSFDNIEKQGSRRRFVVDEQLAKIINLNQKTYISRIEALNKIQNYFICNE